MTVYTNVSFHSYFIVYLIWYICSKFYDVFVAGVPMVGSILRVLSIKLFTISSVMVDRL